MRTCASCGDTHEHEVVAPGDLERSFDFRAEWQGLRLLCPACGALQRVSFAPRAFRTGWRSGPWSARAPKSCLFRPSRAPRREIGKDSLTPRSLSLRLLSLSVRAGDAREHMTNAIRILGLDPGLRRTGWGVIVCEGSRLIHVAHGVISPDERGAFSDRLLHLFERLCEVIEAHRPDEAAVEEVFVNMNPSSTLKLGHARAASLIAPARAGLPVAEYATRAVKKAVVGTGAADKAQVGFMIRRLLPAAGETCEDSADALAVAVTHAHLRVVAQRLARGAA
jgi:crossover junction endodeoxyribonuclease RuvC